LLSRPNRQSSAFLVKTTAGARLSSDVFLEQEKNNILRTKNTVRKKIERGFIFILIFSADKNDF
jgi:hypothetical protein